MQIREARVEDAPAIARVNVASWRTTYRGLMPDEVLDGMSVEKRLDFWRQAVGQGKSFFYVACEEDEVVGYVTGGACREPETGYAGELYAIYLLKEHQGRGIGRDLTRMLVGRLIDAGYESMLVWVLEGNPAQKFYEALGGQFVKRKTVTFGSADLDELAYGWTDIRKIVS